MKKSIFKKFFIKISKFLGYEIIDQNEFYSPTLDKSINENLSNINKSIVMPLGEVKLTRKVKSILILFRTNTNIDIWDQNKKRIFEYPKIEYALRSLNSLIKNIKYLNNNNNNLEVKLKIVEDNSSNENLKKISDMIKSSNLDIEVINHKNNVHKNIIKKQTNNSTFSNLSSLLKCFEIAKDEGKDLVFFIEDDYIFFESALNEIVTSYERISSQINRELFICPTDYPYFYMNNHKTNILIGSKRHWRLVSKTLCSFITSHSLIKEYWSNFYDNCLDRHDPFEKYLNKIYEKEICISPIKSLSLHMTNVNSSYGLSPFIDYKSLWDENDYK
tara:strand:+ start:129 stop:1121 length:993 start_codon:yes stop_codon:yes gene_type:complete